MGLLNKFIKVINENLKEKSLVNSEKIVIVKLKIIMNM